MEQDASPIHIVFFGNSLTAAYGLEPDRGFVSLLEQKLLTTGYSVEVINAGISGETTAGGLQRIPYILETPVDILVLELGINDAFEGEDASVIKRNLQKMIDQTRAAHPSARILLLGIKPPAQMAFHQPEAVFELYRELARENQLALTEDILSKVRQRPGKYLFDDIHPNEEGHRLLADTVWPALKRLMRNGEWKKR